MKATDTQVASIEKHCPIISSSLDTIEACGGGSARCMMAGDIFTTSMIEQLLHIAVEKALQSLYGAEGQSIQFQKTRKDFDGDITLVVFPFLRTSKKGPEQTADELGQYLQEKVTEVCCYNVVKGFLNLSIDKSYWLSQF